MNQLSEFILLADVHGLGIWVIIILIQDTGKTTLHLTRGVKLQDAVVQ